MRVSPIQSSFAGGEISPRLRGRVEAELYKRSLGTCLNFEPTPQGSLLRRGGTNFIAGIPAGKVRFIPMRMRDEQDFVLVLSDLEMRVYSVDSGVLISTPGAVAEMIVNGDFSAGLTPWQDYNGPTVVGNQCLLGPAGHSAQGRIYQSFTLAADQDVVVAFDVIGTPTSFLRVILGDGPITPPALPTNRKIDANIPPASGTGHQSWSLHLAAGTYCLMLAGWDDNVVDNVSVTYSTAVGSSGYAIPAPWTADQLDRLQFASESALNVTYLAHPDVEPHYVQRAPSGSWTLAPITFTAPPSEWGSGNWPSVVEVFQSRLWLGATHLQANTLWASRTGEPFDFNYQTETPPGSGTFETVGTDGLIVPVATKGAIRWLRGRQVLLFGTDLGEHTLVASQGVLTPTDLQVRQESAFGSASEQAIDLGDQIVYVSRDHRKIRTIDYSREADAWQARDITFVAEHLTEAGIQEAHYAPDPHGTLALLLEDGTLALCTYNRAEQVVGWWRAAVAGGTVLTAAVSDGPDGSVLFLGVERDSGNSLESIPLSEVHPARRYLDGAAVVDISAVTVPEDGTADVSVPDHLAEALCEVFIDGVYRGQVQAVAGLVAIDKAGAELVVGLPFTSSARTLPYEGGNPAGTAQGSKRRFTKCMARLNDSAMPKIGGERPADRHPATNMDEPEPPFTGDVSVWARGWDDAGQVLIEQDLPLRTEVLAIFGSVVVNDL